MQYAKITNETLSYPKPSEFRHVSNWDRNEPLLRRRGYMPLTGEPEQRDGFRPVPASWHIVQQSETRKETRNADPVTGELFMEDVMLEDPETHEQRKIGERNVAREVDVVFDTSYIQVDEYDYEPVAQPGQDTTERDTAEKAIVQAIMLAAVQYGALQDLAEMDDITIPALKELATGKGMPDAEFDALITKLTPYKWQLEAVENMTWADCWAGLKSRFAQWMQELSGQTE